MAGETLNAGPARPFRIAVSDAVLDDLRARLARARWPEPPTAPGSAQGAAIGPMRALIDRWSGGYDWRACEAALNASGGSLIEIGGLDIHVLHQVSPHPQARPLILTHGWPGGVIEFLDVAPMLLDPPRYGGAAADAFHLVIPALPGFGFSAKPLETGWGLERIADAWAALMRALGYERYLAQGGDWGSEVTMLLADRWPQACLGAHLNLAAAPPPQAVLDQPTQKETAALRALKALRRDEMGYMIAQATKPQTIGYALTDSPLGQAAWIYEKFASWTDHDGAPEDAIALDRMLDLITLYWVTASAASSARLYWESARTSGRAPVHAPVGLSIYPKEIHRPSRRWAENRFKDIRFWSEPAKGGHFPALETPEAFAAEVRAAARALWR